MVIDNSKKKNRKTIRFYKDMARIVFWFALVFVILAVISTILCLIMFFAIDEHNVPELLYWLAISFATIALCFLPISTYLRDRIKREKDIIENELTETFAVADRITIIVHSTGYLFVKSVIADFKKATKTVEVCSVFHKYSNNEMFCVQMDGIIKSCGVCDGEWIDILNKCIKDRQYIINNNMVNQDTQLEPYKLIDLFINELIFISNHFETIALKALEMQFNKKMFLEEIFDIIDRFYCNSYFLLWKFGKVKGYEKLDSMCRLLYSEKSEDQPVD